MHNEVFSYFLIAAAPLLAADAAGELTETSALTQSSLSITPTIPPSVTAAGPVSSVLATATLAPNLGNPADISTYPTCAVGPTPSLSFRGPLSQLTTLKQICNNTTVVAIQQTGGGSVDTSNLQVACGANFRSLTAGCEAAICDNADYTKTQLLAQQLCGSSYNNNATLGSSVSSAVVSATAAAIAATSGKDPTVLTDYPLCAVSSFDLLRGISLAVNNKTDTVPSFFLSKTASPVSVMPAVEVLAIGNAFAKVSSSTMPSVHAREPVVVRPIFKVSILCCYDVERKVSG